MWPWCKAAAGSVGHELIVSTLFEIRNHDVRSIYIPLQPPDSAYNSMSIDDLCAIPLILHETALGPPCVPINRRRMNENLGERQFTL